MAESVVAFVVGQLSTLLQQEYAQLREHREGLQFINDELGTMRAFLRDVEVEHEQNNELQEWVKQVREAAYDIEDVIDKFTLVFAHRHRGGFYGRVQNIYTSIKTLSSRHQFSSKINEIKHRVENISTRHQRYRLDYSIQGAGSSIAVEDNAVRDIRERAILLEEDDLVGIEAPKHELMSHILDGNTHLKVVSVLGMGGIGKTTLVRRVYEDAKVKRQFHSHAWVTISQTFKIELILKDIIQQLHVENKEKVPQEVESKDVVGLKLFLRDFLQERRYIIIFDDIWSIDAWEAFECALPDCNCGSRVMLTTRIADVAFSSCNQHYGPVYRMKVLSNKEAWTLFCNKTFEDKCCPSHLESISCKILKKCEGLPLAIVCISGILFLKDKTRLEEWEKVQRSLGGKLEGTGKLNQVKKVLLLSYNDLPYYLKCCLLYVGLYPEDSKINAIELIELLVSEGFAQDREGMSSMEITREYIDELVNRGLIQLVRDNVNLDRRYHVHDLVREIALSKAKEHNIFTIKERYTQESDKVRRLVIHEFNNDAQEDIWWSKHLRSLVMFHYLDHMSTSSFLKFLCGRSKLLKVLHLKGSPLESIPKQVFKLFHLRYLNLDRSKVKVIPKSIKNLQNLEVLSLVKTEMTKLPVEILKLGKLQALWLYRSANYSSNYAFRGFRCPNEIGRLFTLQSLLFVDADNDKIVKEVGKLRRLRSLGITKLRREDGKQLCRSLEMLTNLRDLKIVSKNEDEILDLQHSMSTVPQFLRLLVLDGHLEKVPPWVPSIHGLTRLNLWRSGLTEDQLECLQHMPNLLQLTLVQAYEEENLCFKAEGFKRLELLVLKNLKQLRHVTIEEGAMPHLKGLRLESCELVEELPQGIQNLSELREVRLLEMRKELIMEMENGKTESENYRKIAHVPKILVGYWMDGKWENHYL